RKSAPGAEKLGISYPGVPVVSSAATASFAAVYLHSIREYFLATLAFSLSSMYSSPSAKFVRQ
ncbi:hypothetical protein, partial [Sutterella wadsworthensis]|uniref:hypothetical protein n=1 Tax=Sutterella wadsworthensis TaxID=40545 RepID=UPI003966E2B9